MSSKEANRECGARLSALREDEDDESVTISKSKNRKSRFWVLEQLSRDVQLWWDKNDRSKSLRSACLLVGALSSTEDSVDYAREWVLVTLALNKLHDLIKVHFDSQKDEENKVNWYYKIGCIRGLVARLYIQAATLDLLQEKEDGGRLFAQAQGISDKTVAEYFYAYLSSSGRTFRVLTPSSGTPCICTPSQ